MRRLNPLPNRLGDERGVVAVWLAACIVVLLGFAGWAVDFSHWNSERTRMQKAADAAALAGAVYLPDDPAGAIAAARKLAAENGYSSGVSVTTLSSANQLKVTINHSVTSSFAQFAGIDSASFAKHAVSEFESPQPLDIVLILDRTGSMRGTTTPTSLDNVKAATLAVLGYLNPKHESIALGTLGPSFSNQTCTGVPGAYGKYSGNDDGTAPNTTWMIAPYPLAKPANDYQNADGTVNANSQIVKTVNCLEFGNLTDLGDPVAAATSYLNTYGRPGSKRGIILMTDGAANFPGTTPCGSANGAAAAAKAFGIQVLTIGFLSNNPGTCVNDGSGSFKGSTVTRLLASMASPIKGVAAVDNGCTAVENTDGDNFFCQPKGGDIKSVFLAAVAQLAGRLPRIIE
jgi:Flp pilus assembly protein TadG